MNSGIRPELEHVLGLHLGEHLHGAVGVRRLGVGAEAHGAPAEAVGDHLEQALEGAAADEQHVLRVDLDHRLLGVLAAALGRDVGHRALEDLQQGLLHALAGDIAAHRRRRRLAGDLVDLVEVDDPLLGAGHVVVGRLQQPHEDVLHVLAHVPGLGEDGGVGHAEGDLQDLGQGLGQQGLARARGPHEKDVALLQLDAVEGDVGADALVVVVHGHGEDLLRLLLADDVLVEVGLDIEGLGQGARLPGHGLVLLLGEDVVAELDALVADVHRRPGDDAVDLAGGAGAEGAARLALGGTAAHGGKLSPAASGRASPAGVMISSMMPYSRASSALMKKSRSVSERMRSRSRPVRSARMWLICSRIWMISRAWISTSAACPPMPPMG